MNCHTFAKKALDYEKLLNKPYWHLFEVAEYISGITNLDMFDFLTPVLAGAFQLEQVPVGSNAFNEDEEVNNFCIDNYDRVLRIVYNAILKDKIESYPIKMTFFGRSTSIENEFPHLKDHSYLVRPIEVLYLLLTEGIVLPDELQTVLKISQIPSSGMLTKGSLNSLKRDAVSQVIRLENPKDELKDHRERLTKLREHLRIDQSIMKLFQHQKVKSKGNYSLWNQDFKSLSLALHFLHTNTGNRAAIAFVNTKPNTEGALPYVPLVMQEQDGNRTAFDFQRMKEVLKIVSLLLLFKYRNMTSKDLLHHPLIQMYGTAGGNAVTAITKFILKDTLETLDFFASSTDPIL